MGMSGWPVSRIILLAVLFGVCGAQNPVLVNLPQGWIAGFHVDYGSNKSALYYGQGDVFLGIPYVKPPIDNLRFQKPEELCSFPGPAPYNATYFRPACPSADSFGVPQSEDCLYLNVFTPSVKPYVKYPVMVWIHGGSLKGGYAMQYTFRGAIRNLVSRGVVVVTIQYRLGMLGFFTTHSPDFPPNLGMLDQVEALRWVANNIANFGGDPYRVTLFGQSAGLFQGAILESGVIWTCYEGALGFTNHSFRRAQALCNMTLDDWENNRFGRLKDCLMPMDYKKWLPLDDGMPEMFGWRMSQDDYFLPDTPKNLASHRRNIPIMLGSMLNEYSAFDLLLMKDKETTLADYTRQFYRQTIANTATSLGNETEQVTNVFEKTYSPPNIADDDHMNWLKTNDRVKTQTCGGFSGWIGREVDYWLANGNQQVFLYEYTHASNVTPIGYHIPGWDPVPHSAEIPFVWMQEEYWEQSPNVATPVDYALLDWFGETWTNFAKYGFPRLNGEWRPIPARGQLDYMRIGDAEYSMQSNYRQVDQVIWNSVVPALAGELPPDVPDYNNGTNRIPDRVALPETNCKYPVVSSTVAAADSSPTMTSTTTSAVPTTTSSSPQQICLRFLYLLFLGICTRL